MGSRSGKRRASTGFCWMVAAIQTNMASSREAASQPRLALRKRSQAGVRMIASVRLGAGQAVPQII